MRCVGINCESLITFSVFMVRECPDRQGFEFQPKIVAIIARAMSSRSPEDIVSSDDAALVGALVDSVASENISEREGFEDCA